MNVFHLIWRLLTAAFYAVFGHPVAKLIKVDYVDELPRRLDPTKLYVIREKSLLLQASMNCPDGCGTVINLNLLSDDHPCWKLHIDQAGAPTLSPSVWRREGCGAHYFLRAGKVVWCQ